MRHRWPAARRFVLPIAVVLAACDPVEDVRRLFDGATPRESYVRRLESAGLASSAAVRDWVAAGEAALTNAPLVDLPYEESGYLAPTEPLAVAVRFDVVRGERISVALTLHSDTAALAFLDLFRAGSDTAAVFEPVSSADSAERSLEFEPRRPGEYAVRMQPELLRGGRYTLRISRAAALAFPVRGRGRSAVQSVFGDPRDAGAREHHGIDIFAPRGTPVVAVADAHVRRVNETNRGGRVVWLRDERRGLSLYYAHLDSQLVTAGTDVRAGDTVGLVGNSGNARTTPPHLHFGIYSRGEGPLDPLPFVYQPERSPPSLAVDTSAFGAWLRGTSEGARLRAAPDPDADVMAELPVHTAARVVAGTGSWYRVRLPDGRSGYLAASVADVAATPVEELTPGDATPLLERPVASAAVMDSVMPAERVDVYARFGDYLLVSTDGSLKGWMRESP